MTRVCHMTSVHKRYDTRIFQKECCSLAKAGYDVSLVVCDEQEDEERDGVHIVSVHYEPKSRMDRMRKAAKLVYQRALALDADIYQIHDPELLPYAKKLAKQGKKVIFDSHEIYYYQIKYKGYLPKPFRNLVATMYRAYEKRVLSKLDAVVVPCTIDGENPFANIAKQIVFINNLPKQNFVEYIPYERKSVPVKCCYAGTLSISRGLREMISAARQTDTNFILAGSLEALQGQDRIDIEQTLSDSIIDYKGVVDRDGVKQIYAQSHIGLSILHNEGQYGVADNLPTKVYEYMLAGMPIIISDQPAAVKFIGQYNVGILVDSENQTEINNALSYLKNHPSEASEMGTLGRRVALEQFCWEREEEKLLCLYAKLSENLG